MSLSFWKLIMRCPVVLNGVWILEAFQAGRCCCMGMCAKVLSSELLSSKQLQVSLSAFQGCSEPTNPVLPGKGCWVQSSYKSDRINWNLGSNFQDWVFSNLKFYTAVATYIFSLLLFFNNSVRWLPNLLYASIALCAVWRSTFLWSLSLLKKT